MFPFAIYEKVAKLNDMYMPVWGSGVYAFSYYTEQCGYQVYYVGKAENDIGHRLYDHYKRYSSGKVWLPKKIDYFNADIYKYFSIIDQSKFEEVFQGVDDGTGNMAKVGKCIIDNTYIGAAQIITKDDILVCEPLLQYSILEQYPNVRRDWIGASNTSLPGDDYTIINNLLT